jgi:SOS response regulatory protein OraA/RecX
LKAIEEKEYFTTLSQLLRKKLRLYNTESTFLLRQKLIKYAMDKGYSYEEFQKVEESVFGNEN